MIKINDCKRLIKRCILANITTTKSDLFITPLISGKHGIGKSQMIKTIAKEMGGECITIEGGTLKEGEITGLPYQYKDDNGNIKFRFLPYYAVERIQNEEKRLYFELNQNNINTYNNYLIGDENKYSNNDISPMDKINLLLEKKVKPVIIFIDEINRTENSVYKELMNILLTRTVNGYVFPWWCFFVGAMNPSTQNSLYATNEMDPAQLDRFIKFKVTDNSNEWISYAKESKLNPVIIEFIKQNPKCLSSNDKELEDEEKPTPSPRGWDMIDTIINSIPLLTKFFNEKENDKKIVDKDIKEICEAKLGSTVGVMFLTMLNKKVKKVTIDEFISDDERLTNTYDLLSNMDVVDKTQLSDQLLNYFKENITLFIIDKKAFESFKIKLKLYLNLLDSSNKLLFAQNINDMKTDDGEVLITYLYDLFDQNLLDMLDLNDKTKKLIKGSK